MSVPLYSGIALKNAGNIRLVDLGDGEVDCEVGRHQRDDHHHKKEPHRYLHPHWGYWPFYSSVFSYAWSWSLGAEIQFQKIGRYLA